MSQTADNTCTPAPVGQEGPCNARRKCCGTCAGRNDTDTQPSEDLWDLAYDPTAVFYCHAGMSPDKALDFSLWDERDDGTPVKADGSPADLCAAFWAYRRAVRRELDPFAA